MLFNTEHMFTLRVSLTHSGISLLFLLVSPSHCRKMTVYRGINICYILKASSIPAHQTEYGTTRLYSPKETDVAEFSGRSQPSSQKNREESESLLQHIQVWTQHLRAHPSCCLAAFIWILMKEGWWNTRHSHNPSGFLTLPSSHMRLADRLTKKKRKITVWLFKMCWITKYCDTVACLVLMLVVVFYKWQRDALKEN